MKFDFDLLKRIVSVYGPSGRENRIKEVIKEEIKDYVDSFEEDALGNLIARKKGPGKKIMISSHMDQIGLIVIDIDKNGFLRFSEVGGISPDVTHSQRVIFENGTIGVVMTEHLEDSTKRELDKMYIDIGARNKAEAEKLVEIGDMCVYHSSIEENENVVFTPYLDDRIGCYIAIEAIKSIKKPVNDLYFVFSVQEEFGLKGAKTAAYQIEPDYGIALDVTLTGDTPKAYRLAIDLHKGAAIKVMDRSLITSTEVRTKLIKLAKENDIPYQLEILEFGGTDGGPIQISRTGVLTGVISIPTRYVHSTCEMASKEDIRHCLELLTLFLGESF